MNDHISEISKKQKFDQISNYSTLNLLNAQEVKTDTGGGGANKVELSSVEFAQANLELAMRQNVELKVQHIEKSFNNMMHVLVHNDSSFVGKLIQSEHKNERNRTSDINQTTALIVGKGTIEGDLKKQLLEKIRDDSIAQLRNNPTATTRFANIQNELLKIVQEHKTSNKDYETSHKSLLLEVFNLSSQTNTDKLQKARNILQKDNVLLSAIDAVLQEEIKESLFERYAPDPTEQHLSPAERLERDLQRPGEIDAIMKYLPSDTIIGAIKKYSQCERAKCHDGERIIDQEKIVEKETRSENGGFINVEDKMSVTPLCNSWYEIGKKVFFGTFLSKEGAKKNMHDIQWSGYITGLMKIRPERFLSVDPKTYEDYHLRCVVKDVQSTEKHPTDRMLGIAKDAVEFGSHKARNSTDTTEAFIASLKQASMNFGKVDALKEQDSEAYQKLCGQLGKGDLCDHFAKQVDAHQKLYYEAVKGDPLKESRYFAYLQHQENRYLGDLKPDNQQVAAQMAQKFAGNGHGYEIMKKAYDETLAIRNDKGQHSTCSDTLESFYQFIKKVRGYRLNTKMTTEHVAKVVQLLNHPEIRSLMEEITELKDFKAFFKKTEHTHVYNKLKEDKQQLYLQARDNVASQIKDLSKNLSRTAKNHPELESVAYCAQSVSTGSKEAGAGALCLLVEAHLKNPIIKDALNKFPGFKDLLDLPTRLAEIKGYSEQSA